MSDSYWLRGAALMHQQCWCWGQDVRRAEGNLLLRYGFERMRAPREVGGSSRYRVERDGAGITLWGFGVGYAVAECGAIYVNRYCFVPRWMGEPEMVEGVWRAEQMVGLRCPFTRRELRRSRRLLRSLMRWIAGYERWVETMCGAEYRAGTLRGWSERATAGERMAVEWEMLARHVEEPPPLMV